MVDFTGKGHSFLSLKLLLLLASLILVTGCTSRNIYLNPPTGFEYSFLDHVVSCTEYDDINISVDYCNSGNDSTGFLINESTLNWSTVCCQFKSSSCFKDNEVNTTTGLEALCSYNLSDSSQVFLTNTTKGYRALCTQSGLAWVDNTIYLANTSTICSDPNKLNIYSLSFYSGWNATCCINGI